MQDKRSIENVVQEIMGLVNNVIDRREAYQDHQISRNWCEYESARGRLESKLRELVENSFSVRKPLSVDDTNKLWDYCIRKYKRPGPYELIAEFCNITNTEKSGV